MPPLPVFRIDKVKRSGATTPLTVMGHLTRTRTTANADVARGHLNRWLVGNADLDLGRAIEDRLAAAGVSPRADATIAVTYLLTASLSFFQPDEAMGYGEFDMAVVDRFVAAAKSFMEEAFGETTVCAVVHLDEATPHVQGVMVPLMEPRKRNGLRLSAKDFFDKPSLRRLQEAWERSLRPLGCGPRLVGSTASHVTNKRYHATVAEVSNQVDKFVWALKPSPPPGLDHEQNRAALQTWHAEQVTYIRQMIRPLAQAAVYGRLGEAESRKTHLLKQRLALAKSRLREAAQEIDARLVLSIPWERLEARFGNLSADQPVLPQICRREQCSQLQGAELIASVVGVDAALAAVVESLRARLERAASVNDDADARCDAPSPSPGATGR